MEGNAYLDFDLRFTKSENGYRAETLQSPGGSGQHGFRLPFQEHELENYLLKIGQRRTGMRKADSPENRAAREFGGKLFETVFQKDLQTAFRKSFDAARAGGHGLRIRLHLGETPELADLPWEYLWQAQRREFLALSAETPIVRYFELPETVKPLAVTPPLRVLVMLSNPSDVECLDVEKEWQKLKEAVKHLEERKLLIVERLERATLSHLQNQLRKEQYHIFHFVGHGSFDPFTQESVLALEDENGRKRLVSGPDLGIYLRDEPALRLVLLNACEGARASRTDPFSGAAQSLVLKGIPAVIAMQFEVSDEAAIAIASGFYAALADDYPVDAALAEARKAVFAAGCTVEWGTPVLYLRAPDGRIFDIDKTAMPKIEEPPNTVVPPRFQPPPLPAEPIVPQPAAPTQFIPQTALHGPRRWVWLLTGMLVTFLAVAGLGVWSNQQKQKRANMASVEPVPAETPALVDEPAPSKFQPEPMNVPAKNPASNKVLNSFNSADATPSNTFRTLPLVTKNMVDDGLGSANQPATKNAAKSDDEEYADIKRQMEDLAGMQQKSSKVLDEMDEQARAAIRNIKTDGDAQPAGSDFNPGGTWWVLTITPGVTSRFYFDAGGAFTATPAGGNQTTGFWSYLPDSSTLSFVFENGSWASIPLTKRGRGFAGQYVEAGVMRDVYLEKEGAARAPSKKYNRIAGLSEHCALPLRGGDRK